jgi:hypothetical protein
MPASKRKKRPEIDGIERLLAPQFENVKAYRYNSASIRVRVVDPCFDGLDPARREAKVLKLLKQLPEDVQSDITMLLLLTPDEMSGSLLNLEFEDPSPSML